VISNTARLEGNNGVLSPMVFQLHLCTANPPPPSADACDETTTGAVTTVKWKTLDGTSDDNAHTPVRDGVDYVGGSGTATFQPGQSEVDIDVDVIGNNTPQALLRWFFVTLTSATGASIDTATIPASGTIIDDDPITASTPPTVTTGGASGIGIDRATISGTVNPQGTHTVAWLEYGTTANYGSRLPAAAPAGQPQPNIDVGSDSTDHTLNFNVAGLAQGTTYHYRIVAQNDSHAITNGSDRTFTTAVPQPPPSPPAPPDNGGTQQQNTKPLPPPPAPMQVALVTRKTTPTRKGVLSLTFSCKGNTMPRCVLSVFIDYNGTPVGSKTFRLTPGKSTVVQVQMKRKPFQLLSRKKKLRVDVGYSAPDGQGTVVADDKGVMLSAPKIPKPRPTATKRK
jgi:hypothetical protein